MVALWHCSTNTSDMTLSYTKVSEVNFSLLRIWALSFITSTSKVAVSATTSRDTYGAHEHDK
jgi:hypothetical protein